MSRQVPSLPFVFKLNLLIENILISKSGKYKLGDLGQSRKLSKSTYDVGDGDSRYLAPEMLNTHLSVIPIDYTKVDIFSLGMTLFELATSKITDF